MLEKKPTTIKSIARELGYNESTVSRVLNGLGEKYRISEKTVKTITEAAEKKNFSPNQIARGLRLKKTFTLGLIVPDISNPFFANVASTIEKKARSHNYNTFLCDSDKSTELEKETLKLLINRKVDGLIVSPIGLVHQHLTEVYNNGMPMVLVDRFFKESPIPFVSSDDRQGSFDAVTHLIQMGHSKIACIQGLEKTSQNIQRVEGYLEALKANNITINKKLIAGNDFGELNGYNQAKSIINKPIDSRPTAIFSVSNLITLGILKAFKEENVIVPNDISLVSFDEQNYSELLRTPMTTVAHSKEAMGSLALESLLDQINSGNSTKPIKELLPTHLILRESVKKI